MYLLAFLHHVWGKTPPSMKSAMCFSYDATDCSDITSPTLTFDPYRL